MKEHLEVILGLKKLKEGVKEDMKSEGGTVKEHRARGGAHTQEGRRGVGEDR